MHQLGQTDTQPAPTPEEQGLIDKFRAAAREFKGAYAKLKDNAAYMQQTKNPALQKEYQEVTDRGGAIAETVSKIEAGLESVTAAAESAGAAVADAWWWLKGKIGLEGLGVLPLIPVLITGAALAAITKWTADAYMLNKKIDEQRRLEAKGLAPAQAAAIVSKMGSGPLVSMGSISAPLMIGAGLFLFLKMRKR